ncbi:MAG: pseudouridine synthase [Candidatus Cryptobacteroides sp.]|nr:pseudouridine synthase [Bacteroidales bacterium]MDD7133132.1 pseudouridine synthase [Bacteroidales bacterium]MDY2773642.1 pseudouridine synthase [Candidatus Cryptobacteroides sp.]
MEYNEKSGNDHSSEGRREYGSNDSRPYRSGSENGGRRRIVTRKRDDRPYMTSSDTPSSFGERREHRPYGENRRPYGDRRNFGDRPARPYRSSEGGENGERNERRSYGDRQSFGGNRRPYGDRKPSFGGRPDGERRPSGEHRNFGENRRPSYGEGRKPSFGGDRKPGFKKAAPGGKPGFGGKMGAKGGKKRPAPKPMFRSEDESGIGQMIDRRKAFENERLSDNDNVAIPFKEECRLNKYIANSGICSRREADNFILAGCVTVNGNVVTELGTKINVTKDDVRFNGERLHGEEKVYIVMNKPKGFVTTTSDPHAEKTVMELLKKCTARVFPVGRLDKNTTGVLMFTNDGEIAERLTHPAYDKKKIYQVSLDKDLTQEDYDKIMAGVTLSDGDVAADALDYIEENDHRKIGIEIHSGKNRIVRRIFESLGYDVKALDRVYFAGLTKKNLKRGDWRYLTEGEVNILKMGAYI